MVTCSLDTFVSFTEFCEGRRREVSSTCARREVGLPGYTCGFGCIKFVLLALAVSCMSMSSFCFVFALTVLHLARPALPSPYY
jgi:hypothetical protein